MWILKRYVNSKNVNLATKMRVMKKTWKCEFWENVNLENMWIGKNVNLEKKCDFYVTFAKIMNLEKMWISKKCGFWKNCEFWRNVNFEKKYVDLVDLKNYAESKKKFRENVNFEKYVNFEKKCASRGFKNYANLKKKAYRKMWILWKMWS